MKQEKRFDEAPKSSSTEEKVKAIAIEADRRVKAQKALNAALNEPALKNSRLNKIIRAVLRHYGADAAELLVERIERNQKGKMSDQELISLAEDKEEIRKFRETASDISQRSPLETR